MSMLLVIAPLAEGKRETARMLLSAGPPFDPEGSALERHHVFLTGHEVVFLFEGPRAKEVVERLIGEPSVWRAAAAWRECLAGRPRLAEDVFSWVRGPFAPEELS